ncbi:hypothetical protein J2S43_004765 [Catenuloplanes nepalensis]|uniref:Ligand-binding protein with streptavidin-like fold n=1 Tax=Catenuloplanes nepalensis TaxID=587533 RepID=A0ABT9MXT4_9ACTN|nr:Atu4866 domain-containing protein [Catenuloplanes nepalensis]MDP9796253.1 hypothetical protein [Catenuloplanes nepalensis]
MVVQLFAGGTVWMPDPVGGIDLRVEGGRIVGAGPGLSRAGADVVDCAGRSVVPLFGGAIEAGGAATFAVLPATGSVPEKVIWWPDRSALLVVDGQVVPAVDGGPGRSESPYLGMWVDTTGYIEQELTADGRYDETRAGRRHAYRGAFRIDGDRIVYRDDQGFWAYGRFSGGLLHHAGYTFERRP